ncbi:hypothetical protein GCM10023093_20000 [Nemorincola caseinilytica]|uniref:Outer membrane protein beta-barrel domain-containing protein n=1 Tax=Nemorincola caseinilytica TaxID=2054315 RepID=A0ABP8NGZ3_9BACT
MLVLISAVAAHAQDSTSHDTRIDGPVFQRGNYMATISAGFINGYRNEYSVPAGFEKGNASGFVPVYIRGEYAVSDRVSIGIGFSFNTIMFNSFRLDSGHNGIIRRTATNRWRVFGGNLLAWYHFGHLLHIPRLDPFVGGGICLNNISETAAPSGDSTIASTGHTATFMLRAGARYYISPMFSIFADAGYDKLSIFSLGMSCRFLPAKK